MPPAEKVAAIEKFVRDISYYDFDNVEMQGKKGGKDFDERLDMMRYRLDEIRRKKPEIADQLRDKQFAGVCADFAGFTAALLRHAGFMAGVMDGFRPKKKSITTADAHAMAYVVWPNPEGKGYKVVGVDGTPSGITEEEQELLLGIQQPSLLEKKQLREAK